MLFIEQWRWLLFFLWLAPVIKAKLECNPSSVRQLRTSDTISATLGNGPYFFSGILVGDPRYYWYSSGVPNTGVITFNDVYVLLGLSTHGAYLADVNEQRFVSTFTLEHTDNVTEPYNPLAMGFIVSSAAERFFYFNEPISVERMRLTILQANQTESFYYWYLDLIGCPMSEAIEPSQPTVSSCSYPAMTSIDLYSTETEQMMTEDISSLCSCEQSYVVQSSSTTITSSSSDSTIVSPSAVDLSFVEKCELPLMVAIIPSLVLLIILCIVIISWIICHKLSKRKTRELSFMVNDGEGTLKDVCNSQLYTTTTSGESNQYNQTNGMIYNEVYKKHGESDETDDMIYNDVYTTKHHSKSNLIETDIDEEHYAEVDEYHKINTVKISADDSQDLEVHYSVINNKETELTESSIQLDDNIAYKTHKK